MVGGGACRGRAGGRQWVVYHTREALARKPELLLAETESRLSPAILACPAACRVGLNLFTIAPSGSFGGFVGNVLLGFGKGALFEGRPTQLATFTNVRLCEQPCSLRPRCCLDCLAAPSQLNRATRLLWRLQDAHQPGLPILPPPPAAAPTAVPLFTLQPAGITPNSTYPPDDTQYVVAALQAGVAVVAITGTDALRNGGTLGYIAVAATSIRWVRRLHACFGIGQRATGWRLTCAAGPA